MEEYLPILELIRDMVRGNEDLLTGGFVGFFINRKMNLQGFFKKKK